jgi:hypothetical protein
MVSKVMVVGAVESGRAGDDQWSQAENGGVG